MMPDAVTGGIVDFSSYLHAGMAFDRLYPNRYTVIGVSVAANRYVREVVSRPEGQEGEGAPDCTVGFS